MPIRTNMNIVKAMDLARELALLADQGEADSRDNGCAVLYGIVRDCSYRIKGRAERERQAHQFLGVWDVDEEARDHMSHKDNTGIPGRPPRKVRRTTS